MPRTHPKPITLECQEVGPRGFQRAVNFKSHGFCLFSLKSILHAATEVFSFKLKLDYVWSSVHRSFNDVPLPLEKFFGVSCSPFMARCKDSFHDWPCLILQPYLVWVHKRRLTRATLIHLPRHPRGSMHVHRCGPLSRMQAVPHPTPIPSPRQLANCALCALISYSDVIAHTKPSGTPSPPPHPAPG